MESITELFQEFLNWLNGEGINGFEEFLAAFNNLEWWIVSLFIVAGLAFTFIGRKIFWGFYSVLWAGVGFYAGFQWGESLGGGVYSYELGILLAILIPITAFSARKVFAYVIGMVSAMFLSLYLVSSFGMAENVSVYDFPFFLTGVVVGLAFLKAMEYLIISMTTLLGSFTLSICLKYFAGDVIDLLIQLAIVVGLFIAGFFVQSKFYANDLENEN